MIHIAVCADEALVRACLDENDGAYVQSKVHILGGRENPAENGRAYDILLLESEANKEREATAWVSRELLERVEAGSSSKSITREKEPLLIRADGRYYRIDREKILYAESVGRKVVLHMPGGEIAYYAKMKETEAELGSRFFRCHRGYLVNFGAVKSYEAGSIRLKNGETILMSKQKYNEFAAAYAAYLRRE